MTGSDTGEAADVNPDVNPGINSNVTPVPPLASRS